MKVYCNKTIQRKTMILLLIYVVFCKKKRERERRAAAVSSLKHFPFVTSRLDSWQRLDPVERKDVITMCSWFLPWRLYDELLFYFSVFFGSSEKSSLFREQWEFNPFSRCVSELSWHDRLFLCDLSTQTHSTPWHFIWLGLIMINAWNTVVCVSRRLTG